MTALTTLDPKDVVNISVNMAAQTAITRGLNSLLILGDSGIIPVSENLRTYSNLTGVVADFSTSAPEYLAAQVYFAQSPSPATVQIGRTGANPATYGYIRGAALTSAQQQISVFNALSTPTIHWLIAGTTIDMPLVPGSWTSIADMLSHMQDVAHHISVTFDATTGRFTATNTNLGSASQISIASNNAISDALGMSSNLNPTIYVGVDVTTVTPVNAVANAANVSNQWYACTFACASPPTTSDYSAVATLIEASSPPRIFGITTPSPAVITNSTSDVASVIQSLNVKRTLVQYSSFSPYAVCAILSKALAVDYGGTNSTITLKFKTEAGIIAENLTETQSGYAKGKNCNYFVAYGNGVSILQEGVMSNGYYVDEVTGLDNLYNDLQTAIWNLLLTSNKLPYTDAGVNSILSTMTLVATKYVGNGLIAPGIWYGTPYGDVNYGDMLTKGYSFYVDSVDTITQSLKTARVAPTITMGVHLAGAIHFVNATINVSR